MIYEKISSAEMFRDKFIASGRGNQYTYEGFSVIFDWLESQEGDCELDVIAICSDIVEMEEDEIVAEYDLEKVEEIEGFLQKNTTFIRKTDVDTYIFYNF
ncbi:MAG: hypothetical protein [Podoviridae sp. cty5g4]|nr:MAG: hypothetical protein [Podoviridae sp. cty5g4]